MASARDTFLGMVHSDGFIRRAVLHAVNHRVQDFADPLTHTLVLMATAPLQLMLCESGLLPFKTNLLPVLPYSLLTAQERALLHTLIQEQTDADLHETIESNGQYTLTLVGGQTAHLCKQRLLYAFVDLMLRGGTEADAVLCGIVLQRFWSRVSTPSEVVSHVMARLEQGRPPPPPTP